MYRLENKVAIVYGDGAVGAAITKAFAREGASVFLTGRTTDKLDAIAREVIPGNGSIETTQLDALDEKAVELQSGKFMGRRMVSPLTNFTPSWRE